MAEMRFMGTELYVLLTDVEAETFENTGKLLVNTPSLFIRITDREMVRKANERRARKRRAAVQE